MSRAEDVLRQAGWFPGRVMDRDAQAAIMALRSDSYLLEKTTELFLREYSGIAFQFPNRVDASISEMIKIDAAVATSMIFPEHVRDYSDRAGETMVPVGLLGGGKMVVMLGQSGSVYFGIDETLVKVGQSWFDAVEVLLSRGTPELIE